MAPNVGVSVTCNTNCSHWCPRVLRIFCCCCKVDEKVAKKTNDVAKKHIKNNETQRSYDTESSSIDLSSYVHESPEKEVSKDVK